MQAVFFSSEAAPFAKTGGLADVARWLPASIAARGVKTSVFMPLYGSIDTKKYSIKEKAASSVTVGGAGERFRVYGAVLDRVNFYFIRRDRYFARKSLYGTGRGDYKDNARRFIFFQSAAVKSMAELGIKPDVLHTNDWQTALVPHFAARFGFASVPSVYTVHNLAYQGIFHSKYARLAGIKKALLFRGRLNMMYYGLSRSTAVSTVSPTYAGEIRMKKQGCGLEGVIKKVPGRVHGILNGLDYSHWAPSNDRALPARYGPKNITGKVICKKDLMSSLGLAPGARLLAGFVGRLSWQKGIDVMIPAIEKCAASGVRFAVLADGDASYAQRLKKLSGKFPGAVSVTVGFDEPLARRIYAASDIFLMPSRYEPCGLAQMIALAYGAAPVVNSTGGLKDTVRDYSSPGGGTGFVMKNYSSAALVWAINRARAVYSSAEKHNRLVKRAMSVSFSWDKPAKEYIRLYAGLRRLGAREKVGRRDA